MGVTLAAPAVSDKDATASNKQSADRLGFNLWHIIPLLKKLSQLQLLVIKSQFDNTLVNAVVLVTYISGTF